MCGISGIFNPSEGVDLSSYYSAHSLLKHRGPDDEGFVFGYRDSSDGFGGERIEIASGDRTSRGGRRYPHILSHEKRPAWVVGHHRLSIIDLSDHGHQPMFDPSGRYFLSYNGEVYNYVELRRELVRAGYEFSSESDTEVVLYSLIEWGVEAFSRFNGMWALAWYDTQAGELLLSRDRFGIKPLYYIYNQERLSFASEVKFFKPLQKLTPNENAIADYLATSITDCGEHTFQEEVLQIRPGEYGMFRLGGSFETVRYWDVRSFQAAKGDRPTLPEAEEKFLELFSSSLRLRMRSDVPVGTLLSGGLDSTAIVCQLAKEGLIPKGGFHFFSAVFREEEFSEKKYIDDTKDFVGGLIEHFVYPEASRVDDELDQILETMDYPFRSLAVYSQNNLYREVRKKSPVVVLLNGQGSDELFGGYTNEYYSLFVSLLQNMKIIKLMREAERFRNNRSVSALFLYRKILKDTLRDLFPGRNDLRPVSHPVLKNSYKIEKGRYSNRYFDNALKESLTYSALPEYLRYEDRNSMAYSLESRLPFMDYRLVEWAFSLPDEYKIDKGVNKKIVRDSVKNSITPSVLSRKDKMGFVSPQEVWQRNELKPLVDEAVNQIEFSPIDKDKLLNLYDDYTQGRSNDWGFWWRITLLYRWLKLN